jgi:HD-like signal output (HDOD) protein
MAGLLHDIGFLLLGHLRKAEFNQLNAAIRKNPEIPVHTLEQKIVGTNHNILGGVILQKWGLPEPLVITAREHHNSHYSGAHHLYPALARLSDHLLKLYEISDINTGTASNSLYEILEIDEAKALAVTEELMKKTGLFEEAAIMVAR